MSKKSKETNCNVCNKKLTLRTYIRHIRENHQEEFKKIEDDYLNCFANCLFCDAKFNPFTSLNNFFFNVRKKKICKKGCWVWNKGLTKETDLRVLQYSKNMQGNKNPIFKTLKCPKKTKKWKESLKRSITLRKKDGKLGRKLSDPEKKKFKQKYHETWIKNGKKPKGMLGKFHSEETKQKLRESTTNWLAKRGKTSKLETDFYNLVCTRFRNEKFEHGFSLRYYIIDIAIPAKKIAIEVDGDFYHSNESAGFFCVTKIQKKNKINDQKKNLFLSKNGWKLIRIWETDINTNIELVLKRIEDELRKN